MVNAKKHKAETKSNPLELSDEQIRRISMFYSCDTLTDDIISYCENKFEKPLDPLDVINVSIFTLYCIVKADTDSDKQHILDMIAGMVNDKYHLNEWIYKMSAVIRANDKTLCDAIVSGDINDLDAKIDKDIKEAEFKAWNTELSVIKRKKSVSERIDEIKGEING